MYRKKTCIRTALVLVLICLLSSCGRIKTEEGFNTDLYCMEDFKSSSNVLSSYSELHSWNGEVACCYETDSNMTNLLLFSYEKVKVDTIHLEDFHFFPDIPINRPYLFNNRIIAIQATAYDSGVLSIVKDDFDSKLFVYDLSGKTIKIIEIDNRYCLYGSVLYGNEKNSNYIVVLARRKSDPTMLLLELDLEKGVITNNYGRYQVNNENDDWNFHMIGQDGAEYVISVNNNNGEVIHSLYKIKEQKELIVEDLFPPGVGQPPNLCFYVDKNEDKLLYLGYEASPDKHKYILFSFDMAVESASPKKERVFEDGIFFPFDEYSEYYVLSKTPKIINGFASINDVMLVEKNSYLSKEQVGGLYFG